MLAIETVNLTKEFKGKTAVENLNLAVKEGELFSLLGVNGAGKTTTIKMLCGLIRPSSGDALLLGNSIITNLEAVKQIINVSPQETAVAENLSVKENLITIAGIYGLSKKEAEKSCKDIIEELELAEVEKSKAKVLSGGWKRRLSIAMALITKPKILFLDEPTLGLDVLARHELWSTIEKIRGKITIILTTHYLEEAEALSDRIAIMGKGRLKAIGTAEELMKEANKDKFEDAFIELAAKGGR